MHILHVFSTFDVGGPQARTATIINRLGTRYRHSILPVDGRFTSAAKLDSGLGVRLVEPPVKRNSPLQPLVMLRVLRGIAPDLVVTYNWGAMDAVIACLLARRWPLIHTEDGFGPDEARQRKRRRIMMRRWTLPRAWCTVVPSRTLLDIALSEYRLRPEKVRFIPNAVDTERFRPGLDRAWRRERGIPESVVLIGFTGKLRAEKNLGLLLEAFHDAAIQDARLAIVGDGPCREDLERTASELGIHDRVIFAGELADALPVYASLDVFALSSITEQMSVSLLEAMACGLPAIATDVGDNRDLLGTAKSPACVPSGDRAALAGALRAAALDGSLRESLGVENRRRSIESYSLERMVQSYEGVYLGASGVKS